MKIINDAPATEPRTLADPLIVKTPITSHHQKKDQQQQKLFDSKHHFQEEHPQEEKFSEISTSSLILFIEHHLENRLHIQTHNTQHRIWFPLKPNNQNHKNHSTVYAYQHAAEISKEKLSRLKQREHNEYKIEELYALLRHLRTLRQDGVTSLHLQENTPFIKSIYDAIEGF